MARWKHLQTLLLKPAPTQWRAPMEIGSGSELVATSEMVVAGIINEMLLLMLMLMLMLILILTRLS